MRRKAETENHSHNEQKNKETNNEKTNAILFQSIHQKISFSAFQKSQKIRKIEKELNLILLKNHHDP